MDVNGDGNIDILSGSYSRMSRDMAGLFQVLWGTDEGKFKKAEVLKGTDGEPLILRQKARTKVWGITLGSDKEPATDRICTRPTAVDLDGDGKLDIVSGNFSGSFWVFAGEGKGRFAPMPTQLTAEGKPIMVHAHSDPFFVDWDGDGDLDLISGSSQGGVFLCTNKGSAKQPKFSQPVALIPAAGYGDGKTRLGEAHLTGPQTATRVWVDDINGDGTLDILVGDSATVHYPAEGLDEKATLAKLAVWEKQQAEVLQAFQRPPGTRLSRDERKKLQNAYNKLDKDREEFMRTEMTGFVWVIYQKMNGER